MRNINRQRVLSLVAHVARALALIILALFSLNLPAKATVDITVSTDAAALANAIIGSNVVLTGTPVLNVGGSTKSSGTFTTVNSNLGLARGIVLSTGNTENITSSIVVRADPGSGIDDGTTREKDIATLTFSFTPKAEINTVSFASVFVSQEYENITPGQLHNDNFAITLSGGNYNNTNIATIPGTTTLVGIQTLNKNTNSGYYRDNRANPRPLPDVRYYGASTVLIHSFKVVPGTTYTAAIRIADGVDGYVNSAVFIGVMPNLQLDLSSAEQGTGHMTIWNGSDISSPTAPIAGADVAITGDNIPGDITTLASATITLNNPEPGDLLSIAGTLPAGITASAYAPATGTITLSGTGSYAAYQTALAQIRYSGTASTADPAINVNVDPAKTVNVVVYNTSPAPNPPSIASNTATATIDIASLTITTTFFSSSATSNGVQLNDEITYYYSVINTGTVPMYNVSVSDMHGSPPVQVPLNASGITGGTLYKPGPMGAAASTDTTPNDGIWDTLAPRAGVTFTYKHRVTQAEVDHG